MARIDVNKVELVWPGKYNEDGTLKEVPRVDLPFQVIETINQSRATREAKKKGTQQTLFDVWKGDEGDTFEDGWKNKLIWGDNLLVMGSLLKNFAGKIDLIYIDPPFATGADFSFKTSVGEQEEQVFKDQSIIEEKAYRDTWGDGLSSYLGMIRNRLVLLYELLCSSGTIYVQCDHRVNALLRIVLDEVFGQDNFMNHVIWGYKTGGIPESIGFSKKHDDLLVYTKSKNPIFNRMTQKSYVPTLPEPHTQSGIRLGVHRDEICELCGNGSPGQKYRNVIMRDVWDDINSVFRNDQQATGYATQKPEKLLERIISSSSKEGDLVADFFCGSGTTLSVAEKMGRRWIGCDLGRWAIHTTRKRLLGIKNCKPFEVLNLGKYERQYWQKITFGDTEDKSITEQTYYEYLAFVLKLYGAEPISGVPHLHGKKGKAIVRIGSVDAPVTIDEIIEAIDDCCSLKQNELHILGWEWEMGLYELMVEEAGKKGVKLTLLQIPREVMESQAAAKGDVKFFELAYLETEIMKKEFTIQIQLKDFVIPNTELIPEEVRSRIGKWSDYIDYWAVDWDFRNDTFLQGWVAYRTRIDRKLSLISDQHTYSESGKYRILVKVIDIFGNDTSKVLDVEVR
ncbi:site-specific DNA-methyltransferase [Mesotoga sp.]|uniref:site-specific DNA-methyltransferase n=1 Tax=Mesotoga sp. TaxID=2053577 RepID=UPI000A7695E0